MGFKNYSKKLLITLFSILAFIVMLNYFVNPYNIFQQRIFKTTLLKPEAKIQERVTKPIGLKINKRKIDAVFFGTSRVDLGLDRDYYKKLTGKEADNIAIGGLLFYEMFDVIDIALKVHPEIKHIYIGVDYGTFLKEDKSQYKNRASITKNPRLETSEIGVALLCLKTSANSVWSVIKTLSGNKKRMFYSSGKKYIFVNKKMKREFEKTWLEYNIAYGNNSIDTEKIRALNDFYIRQKSLGRDVTLFTMPSHVSEFYLIYKNGCRKDYEMWKKELSQIAPVYDFQYPNKYTTDKIAPDMQTYFDASHSTYLVGNKIMEDIVLGKTDFARLLTKDNVEQYNRQNFIDLQTWAKNNKDMLDWINNTLKEEKNAI